MIKSHLQVKSLFESPFEHTNKVLNEAKKSVVALMGLISSLFITFYHFLSIKKQLLKFMISIIISKSLFSVLNR